MLRSAEMGALEKRVHRLKQSCQTLWLETATTFPEFEQYYTEHQKKQLERDITKALDQMEGLRGRGDRDRERVQEALQQSAADLQQLCARMGLYFDQSFTDGFSRASKAFLQRVKAFDESMKTEYIYQALRNVWIANSLQVIMGEEMACTTPLFAYSMLYPYSDNINDDPDVPFGEKWAMNDRFKKWLEGEAALFQNENEEKIYRLVQMIESVYDRSAYPGVYQSLLGIFNAQVKSLTQQKNHQSHSSSDILDISLEKGGTSVLADGYLIKGSLDDRLEDFCFGYGAFLQFADDLQDVADDLANGHQTLYARCAEKGPLDALANRLFQFIVKVADLHLGGAAQQRCRTLIVKNCFFMVQEAIFKTAPFYSPGYIRALERHFPLRQPFYRRIKRQLKQMLLAEIPASEAAAVKSLANLSTDDSLYKTPEAYETIRT